MTGSNSANGSALRQLAERQTKILDRIPNLEQSLQDLGSPVFSKSNAKLAVEVGHSDAGGGSHVNVSTVASETPTTLNHLSSIGGHTDVAATKSGLGSIAQMSISSQSQSPASVALELSEPSGKIPAKDQANGLHNASANSDAQPRATTSENPDGQGHFTQGASGGDTVATQQRLEKVCLELGCQSARFKSVPDDYYDRSLEGRRDLLGAPSIEHLCKSIVLTNTQAPPEITDCSNPLCSKYYLVVVQYVAKLNTEKVKNFVYGLNDGKLPKKRINMRLAPSDVSDALTGYSHNSVTPFGMKTAIPIILSDAITKLDPPFFWLGAGEVDLKLRLDVSEFVEAVKPFIVDCT